MTDSIDTLYVKFLGSDFVKEGQSPGEWAVGYFLYGVSAVNTFIPPGVVIALVVVAIAVFLLRHTRFGRTICAIGGNEQSAPLMGLPVARTKVLTSVVSGLCSAIGRLPFAFYSLSGCSRTALGMELDTISAETVLASRRSGLR